MAKKVKYSLTLTLAMLISIIIVACGSNTVEKNTFFVGLIDEVNDSTILVKVMEAEYKMTDEIIVPVDNPETYLVGEMVRITFDGNVDETYPAQINKPDNIEILSTTEATEIVSSETAKAEGANGSISLEIPSDWTYTNCDVDTDEAFIDKYSLEVSAKNITSTSATLVFTRMDASITDELTFGEEFTIDKKDGDEWTEVDTVIDGDYGFESVAYIIAAEGSTEHDFDWEWLYGALELGEYRINLQVEDEPVSVHFVLR